MDNKYMNRQGSYEARLSALVIRENADSETFLLNPVEGDVTERITEFGTLELSASEIQNLADSEDYFGGVSVIVSGIMYEGSCATESDRELDYHVLGNREIILSWKEYLDLGKPTMLKVSEKSKIIPPRD